MVDPEVIPYPDYSPGDSEVFVDDDTNIGVSGPDFSVVSVENGEAISDSIISRVRPLFEDHVIPSNTSFSSGYAGEGYREET